MDQRTQDFSIGHNVGCEVTHLLRRERYAVDWDHRVAVSGIRDVFLHGVVELNQDHGRVFMVFRRSDFNYVLGVARVARRLSVPIELDETEVPVLMLQKYSEGRVLSRTSCRRSGAAGRACVRLDE